MAILPLLVSIVSLLGAIAFATYSIFVLVHWPRVNVTILRYHKTRGSDGEVFWHPVYRFQTVDGKAQVAIASVGTWDRPWERGATVRVRYLPANPRRSVIQSFSHTWGGAFWLALLALLFWAIAFWFPRIGQVFP